MVEFLRSVETDLRSIVMSELAENHAHPHGPILGHDVRFNEDAYPFWKEHFDTESRDAMIKEDLQAGEYVSLLLFAIVVMGVIIGLIGVLAATF
jgi:hypothetical protein